MKKNQGYVSGKQHLLCVIETRGFNDVEEAAEVAGRWRIDNLLSKAIDSALITDREILPGSIFRFYVFDFYVVKQLSVAQLFCHYIRKWLTAAKSYVGIDTRVIIIERDSRQSLVNRTTKRFDKRSGY